MNRTIAVVAVVALCVAAAAFFVFRKSEPGGSVRLTMRLAVTPASQIDNVISQATSARFKYEIGKKAGLQPALAQKLTVTKVPDAAYLEAQVSTGTKQEAKLYGDAFEEMLQAQCGADAQVRVTLRSAR